MSRNTSKIDKVLDISNFSASKGFIASSSDDEEDVSQVVGSKLSNIFGSPAPKPVEQNASKQKPLFACSVGLFSPGESGKMEPRGQAGLAVTERNQEGILLIYNVSKQIIATFSLHSGSFTFSVQFGPNSYVSVSSASTAVSFHFDESKQSQCTILTALLMIFCEIGECKLSLGEGEGCFPGCHVLLDEKRISLGQGEIEMEEQHSQKQKVKDRLQPVFGMRKGGCKMVRTSDKSVLVITLKKIKQPGDHKTESIASESETSSSLATLDLPSTADVESEPIAEEVNGSSITHSAEEVSSDPLEDPKTNTKPEEDVKQSRAPIPTPREYPTFHKVIGTEMDRLEIRLEAAVQRMIDRAVEPIQKDMQKMLINQEEILERLRQLEKKE